MAATLDVMQRVYLGGEHPAVAVLRPALARILPANPDIKVKVAVDYGLADVVSARFDAGVRLGEQVAKDMIAVCIGGDMGMAVVGPPASFARRPPPRTPAELMSPAGSAGRLAWGTQGSPRGFP